MKYLQRGNPENCIGKSLKVFKITELISNKRIPSKMNNISAFLYTII